MKKNGEKKKKKKEKEKEKEKEKDPEGRGKKEMEKKELHVCSSCFFIGWNKLFIFSVLMTRVKSAIYSREDKASTQV